MKNEDRKSERAGGGRAARGLLALLALAVATAGCEVTNPGPVQDQFLNDAAARAGVVTGIKRSFSNALAAGCGSILGSTVASVTRELFPSGNPGTCGIDTREGVGDLSVEVEEQDFEWDDAQNARWVAEDAITRFDTTIEASAFESSPFVAEAMVWAGFANRLLGENFCEAVVDGSGLQPRSVFFERAEGHFTSAIGVASAAGRTDLVNAARAGRASVRAWQGNWSGAVDDAQSVPVDFEFEAEFAGVSQDQYNQFYWMRAAEPYRTGSVWNTPYEQYYTDYTDPRTPWSEDPGFEFGDLARFDMQVPFLRQEKYTSNGAGIDLADGREMILIRAEALLRAGDWQDAIDLVNDELRSTVGVDDWSVSSEEEAWTAFRFERGIELWLEARRLWDFYRWSEEGVPGQMQSLEDPSNPDTYLQSEPDYCIPVPNSERETNDDVPTLSG